MYRLDIMAGDPYVHHVCVCVYAYVCMCTMPLTKSTTIICANIMTYKLEIRALSRARARARTAYTHQFAALHTHISARLYMHINL